MNSNNFSNEVAIITGAGQGIGFEIAKQLCINGASVILNDIDKSLAENAAAKISSHGKLFCNGGRCSRYFIY